MREIKFRAWEPRQKVMEDDQTAKFWLSQGFDKHTEKPVYFMQYTGLKDKNGVEIYEGDIFKTDNYSTGVIEYGEVDFGNALHWMTQGFYWKEGSFYRGIHANYNGGVVIGNIYENKELLG